VERRRRLKAIVTSRHVIWATAVASFADSTVAPVPLEAVLIPAMQATAGGCGSLRARHELIGKPI
jgi:hypothetical protein